MIETQDIVVNEEAKHAPWCGKKIGDPDFAEAFPIVWWEWEGSPVVYTDTGAYQKGRVATCHPVTDAQLQLSRRYEIMDVMMMFAPPNGELPSPELILRRRLAEARVHDKAKAEMLAKPMPTDPVLIAVEESARARDFEALQDSRMPNWETDVPPPLTDREAEALRRQSAIAAEKCKIGNWEKYREAYERSVKYWSIGEAFREIRGEQSEYSTS